MRLLREAFNRAAKEPFPPAKPPEPEVKKGALVIVGGGGAAAEIWKKFIDLAGGPDATIVVVVTAMEDPLAPVSSEERALKANGAKNVVALHTRDRKVADDPKFSEVLLKAGGVWFSGGRQWRFVDSYEGTLTYTRFHDVLARGGAIGGSSAGASIQSEYMPRGHPLGNTVVAAEGYERGFGFLPGCAVDQHFFARKRTGDMISLRYRDLELLGAASGHPYGYWSHAATAPRMTHTITIDPQTTGGERGEVSVKGFSDGRPLAYRCNEANG